MTAQSTKNLIVEGIVKITAAQQSSHKPLPPKDVEKFMRDITNTLVDCVNSVATVLGPEADISEGKLSIHQRFPNLPRTPAVPINQSVHYDKLICLFDGHECKMLTRHLKNTFNMTPEQYIEFWNLRKDYPMVTEEYKEQKSKRAKSQGLGKNSRGRPPKEVKEGFSARQSSKILTAKAKPGKVGRPKGSSNINLPGIGRPQF